MINRKSLFLFQGACFLKSNKIAATRNPGRSSGLRDCGSTPAGGSGGSPTIPALTTSKPPASPQPTIPPTPKPSKFYRIYQKRRIKFNVFVY